MFSHSPVKDWNQTTLTQVDWFLFFLPTDKLQDISPVSQFLFIQYYILNAPEIGQLQHRLNKI